MRRRVTAAAIPVAAAVALAAGCGGSSGGQTATHSSSSTIHTAPPPPGTSTGTTTTGSPGALQAEANAAAAGDIPDNQVFLTFRNTGARYSMKYPEGWAQQGSGGHVTFRDKNNIVRIVVAPTGPPTKASVQQDGAQLGNGQQQAIVQAMRIAGAPAFKVVYSTVSAPNAVTGKRVKLIVDRYYLWKGGRRAVVDLGTPTGVDNVDAYRMMIESFRWS